MHAPDLGKSAAGAPSCKKSEQKSRNFNTEKRMLEAFKEKTKHSTYRDEDSFPYTWLHHQLDARQS